MKAFDNSEFEKYKTEAQERWGSTAAYGEYTEKAKDYSGQQWNDLAAEMDGIMADFAACMKDGNLPTSAAAQTLVKNLQNYITAHCYHCTDEILYGLGQMYVGDERFNSNIDRHADGTATYICAAITAYCGK